MKPLNQKPISVTDLRVVCDNMLVALSKKLRLHGIDSVHLEQYENQGNCITLATDPESKRMILTKSPAHFIQLKKSVPPGHCLHIVSQVVEEQVEEVLRYFNVTVSEDDYFSRCTVCNGSKYLTMNAEEARALKVAMTPSETVSYGVDDDDDDEYGHNPYDIGAVSGPPSQQRSSVWKQYPGGSVYTTSGCIRETGVVLQLSAVADGIFEKINEFFCCVRCGKVFWQGSHWDKVKKK